MSYHLNNMMTKGLTFANNAGGASFIYCLTGMLLNTLFDEELEDFNNLGKNALCGGISGMIYKFTRGYKASLVGGLVGASLIASLNFVTDELRERDIIEFEMRFD